ncbi:LysR family transcriptional regulator [Ammoniphilus sp. CFH 90114]|uniref:LysR family transcriptional regulator n=1 Tax=Ammoniphilus sp. CFH 90114 TaxID=2493665 RepID=UPI00100D9C23|nr:LysR family transcriptional regulator [Ammoniphilus sp. CFH 90114]RXT15465.1 LysR family transcriptional regulator [Ammoniphilus sp. CFH 90114]
MELRQLQYFLTVSEELNFSRAAERLRITQPPLSLQIQNLEKELGFSLFHRTNRHVQLTEAGRVFADEVRKILDHLDRATSLAKRTHQGELGTLTVGFVGSATYDILPAVIREFRNQYPHVMVNLLEMSTPVQLSALREDEIDIGVLRPPVHDPTLYTEIISTVPCVLAVPKQHPLTEVTNLSIGDLSPYPFVMLSRKTWAGLYDDILGLCNPMIRQEALEFQTVIGLVAAGIGIAIVPKSAMNLHTQHVVYLDMENQLPVANMGISWRQNDRSPLVQAFIEMAMDINNI